MKRRLAAAAVALYVVALALLLLWPRGADVSGLNIDVYHFFRDLGVPKFFGPNFYGFVFNVLIFVPPAAYAAYAVRRWPWWVWIFAGLGVSVVVEILQATVLSTRTPSFVDVFANVTGALIGALIGWAVRRRCRTPIG